jgi:hypothetical protein
MLFDGTLADETIVAAAALLIAAAVIYRFARAGYKGIQRIESMLGVDKDGRTIAQRLDSVEHQLYPNDGGSLLDKVVKIGNEQKLMKKEIDEIRTISGAWATQERTR